MILECDFDTSLCGAIVIGDWQRQVSSFPAVFTHDSIADYKSLSDASRPFSTAGITISTSMLTTPTSLYLCLCMYISMHCRLFPNSVY